MKKIKFILTILFLSLMVSCTKENDVVDISKITSPSDISAVMTIKQDNSGTVTILPTGTGITQFKIYYGDGTVAPGVVNPGNSINHIFLEGTFQVKIVGTTIDGKTSEVTLPLTVTFFAPTNLVATITNQTVNTLGITVTAQANFATGFKVYFGDVPNEVPVSFAQNAVVSHVYAAAGTYLVTVVAITGGVASTTYTQNVTVTVPTTLALPLDFESSTLNYSFTDFAGENSSVIANPNSSGIDTSSKVVSTTKTAGAATYAGTYISLTSPIDFSVLKKMKMKVWCPSAGGVVKMKLQNLANVNISTEVNATSTVANGWQELTFDFTGINNANNYQTIVVFFDFGNAGNGATYYFDDIEQSN